MFQQTKLSDVVNYETCIIHCSDDESLLISLKDLDSWKTLLTAAAIRNHRPLLDLAEHAKEGEIPSVSYHRKYRSLLTMKRKFEKIAQTTVAGENIPESNDERGELELEDLVGKNQIRAEIIPKYRYFEIALPENVQLYINTALAWDNIDRLEETLSGAGTSNRVNGIAVRARHFGPNLPPPPGIEQARTRKRSIDPAVSLVVPPYNAANAAIHAREHWWR